METRVTKVSSCGRRVSMDLKRKRAAHSERCSTGAAKISSPSLKFGKRRKLRGSQSKFVDSSLRSRKSLLRYYSNLKRSGSPKRLMYYENGEWTDIPRDLLASVKNELQVKKAATEVEIDGHTFLLDFLHMVRFDLLTGLQQPIAWIDEVGNCFFPETFANQDDLRDCCCNRHARDCGRVFSEHLDSNTIKLELQIAIDGSECLKIKESCGESSSPGKSTGVDDKPNNAPHASEVDFSCSKISDHEVDRAFGNVLKDTKLFRNEYLNDAMVKEMFVAGMSTSENAEIVEIFRGSGTKSEARLELFMKQVEITKNCRGDANVRYAWLPSSKAEVSNVVIYGIGSPDACKIKSMYGLGIHLLPANCTQASSNYCDIDENGTKHMILCRVIMGNMELVRLGSEQSYPSSENYDNGVDNLQNPGCYLVWSMNMSSHIFPEYVVSYRVPSDAKGYLGGKENKVNVLGPINCSQGPQLQLDLNANPPDEENGQHQPMGTVEHRCLGPGRTPKTPWVPFSLLFSAISGKVASKEMEKVLMYYGKFRNKSISRGDFVNILRATVGDPLLRSALSDLQCKMPQG